MATASQILANRANALKSTGPRNTEATRFNALKHGMDAASIVIPGEDPALYDELAADYRRQFRPSSAVETFHVETLIHADWQKRRLRRVEAGLYRVLLAEGPDPVELDVALLRDSPTAKLLRKVFSQIASLDRAYLRALNELRRLQHEQEKAADPEFDALLLASEIESDVELASFREKRDAAVPKPVPLPKDDRALRL